MIDEVLTQVFGQSTEGLLNLLIALGILIGGWVVARLSGFLVRRVLVRTQLIKRLQGTLPEGDPQDRPNIEGWVGTGVFWLIMLFVWVAFFQTLQLTGISGPLSGLLNQLLAAAPQLLGAVLILALAWIIASVARFIVNRALLTTRFEERLRDEAEIKGKQRKVRESISDGIFWLVWLLFLPAVLSVLGMDGLVLPVQGVVDGILAAVPKIFAAGLILIIGWFLARIVRRIVTNLLAAANVDQFGERVGVTKERRLSELIGTVIYILVLIPTVITALNALELEAISGPAVVMLTTVLNAVPVFFAALLVLTVAYFAGKLAAGLVTNVLAGIGFDTLPQRLGFQVKPLKGQPKLSEIAGIIVLVAVMLLASAEAANLLGFETLGVVIASFAVWGGQAIAALVIFAIGLYLANLAREVIRSASGQQANLVANLARIAIMVFAIAIALQQLGVAPDIVNLAFGILLGAVGVAVALAFGLGARDVAGRQVESWTKELSLSGGRRSSAAKD
ncbi:MAG: mechanosensitive ion channel [Anaerolineales bacterium]